MNSDTINQNATALAVMAGGSDQALTMEKSIDNAALARFLSGDAANAERASRPFEQVGVVNRCIRIRGDALKSMPLMVSTINDEIVEAGEIMDLINCPYPGMTTEDLVEWIDALVMLTGACYLVDENGGALAPGKIRPVGYGSCRPKYDNDGDLTHYDYRKPGRLSARPIRLDPDQVIPFTLSNYQTEKLHDGLAQIKPGRRSIDQVFAADTANLESLYNGVEPGLVFDFGPSANPTDEQRNHIYRQLDENHRGPDKRNRPIITGGGATVQDFVKKFTEMEFAKLKSMAITDVCVMLGVPPLVAGYSGEAGMGHGKELEEAHEVFWQISVLPMAAWIARKLTINLLPRFQNRSRIFNSYRAVERHEACVPDYKRSRRYARRHQANVHGAGRQPISIFAWFDSSSVAAVRDAAIRRSKEAVIWHEKLGATQADVIEALDLPIPDDHDWQNTWYKPMGLVDIQEDTAPDEASDGTTPEVPEDGLEEDASKAVNKPSTRALTEAQLTALHDAWWKSIQPLVRRMRIVVQRHFHSLRSETLANLDRVNPAKANDPALRRDLIGEVLFDLVSAKNGLRVLAGPLVRQGFTLGGAQSMEDAAIAEGKEPDEASVFNIEDPEVKRQIRLRENRITGVDDTLHARLRRKLRQSLDDGQTLSQIGDVIRSEFNLAGNRAATIARTEVGSAVESAKHEGRKQAGVPLKSWLWSRKETGRQHHMQAERQTIDEPLEVEALFTLPQTGNTCKHPRGTGDAEDDINCGCTTLSRYPGDTIRDARLLAHRVARGFLDIDTLSARGGAA